MAVFPVRTSLQRPLVDIAPPSPADLAPADHTAQRLTHAMVAGHRHALAELFALRCAFVEREAGRALGHRADLVPDAAQDAWLRVACKPTPCEGAAPLDAWLRRVAVNAAIDMLRADLARRAREHRVARTRSEASAFAADAAQLDAARAVLQSLPAEDRAVLELRARTGATLAQLAKSIGLGPAALDSRLRRAAERARQAAKGAPE